MRSQLPQEAKDLFDAVRNVSTDALTPPMAALVEEVEARFTAFHARLKVIDTDLDRILDAARQSAKDEEADRHSLLDLVSTFAGELGELQIQLSIKLFEAQVAAITALVRRVLVDIGDVSQRRRLTPPDEAAAVVEETALLPPNP